MKIIILTPSQKTVGGVERFCTYLLSVYQQAGHEVEIVAAPADNSFVAKIARWIGLGAPLAAWRLGRLMRSRAYDVLVTNGMLAWNLRGNNIINVQHGTFAAAADRIDKGKNKFKWLMKRYGWSYFEALAAKRAVRVVAVSADTAASVKKYYGVEAEVINNSVATDIFIKSDQASARAHFNLPAEGKLALFVGRFEYGKGSDIMMSCLPILKSGGYKLVLAADRQINAEQIISLQNVAYAEMPLLYNACDLFIFPSRHEGCSLALLEAISCELPFISTAVGSATELVALEPSLHTRVCPISSFTQCLSVCLESESEVIAATTAKKLLLTNFSQAEFYRRHLAVINSLKF